MITILEGILTGLSWIFIVLLFWFLFVQIVVRIIRRFIQFPIPSFVARLIDNPLRRRIQPPQQIVKWMGIQGGMSVLEIGPGPGTFTFEAAKHVGLTGQVVAIDIQESIIAKLDEKIQHRGVKNLSTKVASVYELPFPDESFDRVFMVTVLGEIPDKQKALREIKRVLKNDGILAIGELLFDPDYPCKKTVMKWCQEVGYGLSEQYGNCLHYLLTFRKSQ